jgi:thiol:disulfide interchange protein DsbD
MIEPIEQTIVTLPMALALGTVFGFSGCTISCLPYLGPVFLSSDGGIRHSWRTVLPFSLGRLFSYAALCLLAGYLGQYLGDDAGVGQMRWVLGFAAIMVGLALLLRRTPHTLCSTPAPAEQPIQPLTRDKAPRTLMPGGLFMMGAGMALSPCAPLGTVIFSAAVTASALHGLALGLSFGLGAIILPALIFGIGVAYLGTRLREQLQHHSLTVTRLSAALLILTGASNLLQ